MAQQYKVKGIESLSLKDGEMKQVEVDGIDGGKVLLASTGGKVHAMSANCTHFGAPLSKGVLTPDGRLTCPWHGACFSVATGDVEDAPALDPLAKFVVVEKDGAVYITGEEAVIKANRRVAGHKCSAKGKEQVVVVGGGSGTIGALQALREHGYEAPITLISKEGNLPIDRTKLSKALIPDANKLLLRPQEWYDGASISTVTDEVTSVDFSGRTVSTASGKKVPYTKLILASGGTPRKLPLAGFKELSNIFVLRSVQDVQSIMSAVGSGEGKNIVIVGSSFIGLEAGNALAGKKHKVTIIGMESVPLERVMGKEVGAIFQSSLSKNGITFKMDAGVDKATPSSTNSSAVGAVHLKDGTVLPADVVILGVGVAPATEFLKDNAAVTLEKDGSLKVDSDYSVPGVKDVYAVGDIATFPYDGPTGDGKHIRVEHWNVAQNQGRHVGVHIASPADKPKPFIPVFWSALGSQLRYCGNTMNGWDSLVLKGEPKDGKFVAYYAKGDTVAAVASMGMDPYMVKCAELMRAGKMLGKKELEAGKSPLEV